MTKKRTAKKTKCYTAAPVIDAIDAFKAFGEAFLDDQSELQRIQKAMVEDEKDYLKRMLADIPPHVPARAVDEVRKKLQDLEDGKPSSVIVDSIQKVHKTTVEDLMAVGGEDLDKMAANFAAHARNKLKGR
jgi:hypothetical protein